MRNKRMNWIAATGLALIAVGSSGLAFAHTGGGESGPIWVLRGHPANGIGSGTQLRMPAFEVIT
jgi:uncharacterized circularly permuted ATP-grasp superfamily protein